MNDDNEVEVAPKAKCKSFAKNERKKDPITWRCCPTPKAPQGKTPYSFTMYVDDKLKQKDARSRTITEKRIMDILFEVEMGTTCVTPTQTQNSISMSPAEVQYSNATTPFQGQYSSGTPRTQTFLMDLLHNDWFYFILDSIYEIFR